MTSVEDVNLGFRHVLVVAFRLAEIEREIVRAPDDKKLRLRLLHPCLPLRIGGDVGPVIVEEVTLNLRLLRLIEKIKFVSPKIGVISLGVRIVSDMTRSGRLQ